MKPIDNNADLEAIRQRAKEVWLQPMNSWTSYSNEFGHKKLDEPTASKPSSPTRLNNPHPRLVFMATRLHNVPGYHDADARVDKDTYRMDRSVSHSAFEERRSLRDKYKPRTDPLALRQYTTNKDREGALIEQINNIGMGLDTEKVNSLGQIRNNAETEYIAHINAMPSLHRFQKNAGYDGQYPMVNEFEMKSQQLKEIKRRHTSKFNCIVGNGYRDAYSANPTSRPRPPLTSTQRSTECSRFYSAPKYVWNDVCASRHTQRGDYQIHPEWTRKAHANHHHLQQFPRLKIT